MPSYLDIATSITNGKNPLNTMKGEEKIIESINLLRNEFAELKKASDKRIASLQSSFAEVRNELLQRIDSLEITFQNQLKQKDEELSTIKKENKILRTSIARLEEKIDDSEASERRDSLILSGELPTAVAGENCKQRALDLFKEKLRLDIQPSEISTAYRLGKKPSIQGPDKRKILVKLCRRDLKKDIINACKEMKPGFFVNESLTPTRNTILYALRMMKRESNSPIKGTATIDGRVFVWIKKDDSNHDQRILMNSPQKLEDFCLKMMNKPISNYINEWP